MSKKPARAQRPDVNQTIASNVRAELARAGVSQSKAATMLGLTSMWLSRRISGETPFAAQDVALLADFLHVEPGELFRPVRQELLELKREKLPDLDSNQEPAGFESAAEVRGFEIVSDDYAHDLGNVTRMFPRDSVAPELTEHAIVTPIRVNG